MKQLIRQYSFLIVAGIIIFTGILAAVISFLRNNPIKSRDYLPINSKTILTLKPGSYSTFYEFNQSESQYGPIKLIRNNRISNISDLITVDIESKNDRIDVHPDSSMTYSIEYFGELEPSFR